MDSIRVKRNGRFESHAECREARSSLLSSSPKDDAHGSEIGKGNSRVTEENCTGRISVRILPLRSSKVSSEISFSQANWECKNVSVNWKSATSLKEPPLG